MRRFSFIILMLAWCCGSFAQAIVSISEITTAHIDSEITIQGKITSYRDPVTSDSPHLLTISDGTSALKTLIFPEVWSKLDFREQLVPVHDVTATLLITESEGTLTGIVSSPKSIELGLAAPIPTDTDEYMADEMPEEVQEVPDLPPETAVLPQPAAILVPPPESPMVQRKLEFIILAAAFLVFLGGVALVLVHERNWRRKFMAGLDERKRVEETLKEESMRLNHLLSSGATIVYRLKINEVTNVFEPGYVSENIIQLLEYSREEVLQNPSWWTNNIHPGDRPDVLAGMMTLYDTDRADKEYRFRKKSGGYVWLHDSRKLLRDSVGKPYEIVGSWIDISERKNAEFLRDVFSDLGKKLSAITSPRETAQVVLETADALFHWDAACVRLYNRQQNTIQWLLSYDVIDGRRREVTFPSDTPSVSSHSLLEEGPQLISREPGSNIEERLLDSFGDTDRKSACLMFMPIRKGEEAIGLLSVQSYTPHAYTERDLTTLGMIADYCGAALARTFAEEKARRSEERYALAVRGANDGLWDWDLRTQQVYYSPRWKSMLGYDELEITSSTDEWLGRIHEDDREFVTQQIQEHLDGKTAQLESEHRVLHRDGDYHWMLIRGVCVRNESGEPVRMAGSQSDVTLRKTAEEQLLHGAYHDNLTGLPNRLHFMEQVHIALARMKRRPGFAFAVLFIDLDHFKRINDSLGHVLGDQLLVAVARQLEQCIRPGDLVARLGGDEFTVLVDDLNERSDGGSVPRVAQRIQTLLGCPIHLGNDEVVISASIGIALSTTGYEKAEDILRDADTAMYRAKELGRRRYEMFDTSMHVRAMALLQLETDLRKAIERDEFFLCYQPIVNLRDGTIMGFESLVRWQHPTRGLVSPGEFIPVAEDSGLIIQIGDWVLRRACRDLREWRDQVPEAKNISVTVNVSGKQFGKPDLVAQIRALLEEYNLPPSSMKIEITESLLMEHAALAFDLLSQFKGLDMELLIDDFGTGYSSLSYLHQFPIDALKIDQTFIRNLPETEESLEISRAIIALAVNMGMVAIAEGLETPDQLRILRELNCTLAQGYFFSKPVESDAARDMITRVFPMEPVGVEVPMGQKQ